MIPISGSGRRGSNGRTAVFPPRRKRRSGEQKLVVTRSNILILNAGGNAFLGCYGDPPLIMSFQSSPATAGRLPDSCVHVGGLFTGIPLRLPAAGETPCRPKYNRRSAAENRMAY